MCKYSASFKSNSSTYGELSGNNLKSLISSVRAAAEGNRFQGNECHWSVWLSEGDVNEPIAEGGMTSNGARYRIK